MDSSMQIVRFMSSSGVTVGLAQSGRITGRFSSPYNALADLLRLPAEQLKAVIEEAQTNASEEGGTSLLAPIDGGMEVWAGGTLKKCVNNQAVYPLSEQDGLEAQERRYTAHEEGKH